MLINAQSSTIKLYPPNSTSSATVSSDVGKWVRWAIKFRFVNDSSGYVSIYRNNNITNVYGTNGDTNLGVLLQGSTNSNNPYTFTGAICGGHLNDQTYDGSITSYLKHGVYSHTDATYNKIYSFASYTRYMSLTYEIVPGVVNSSPENYVPDYLG